MELTVKHKGNRVRFEVDGIIDKQGAESLAKIFNGDDSKYFEKYLPNMLVYKTMIDVWWKLNK